MDCIIKGFGSTFDAGVSGIPPFYVDTDLIGESIKEILLTQKGERIMRPDFGTNILELIFENDGEFLQSELKSEILGAIQKYEPRAKVMPDDIVIESEDGEVVVTINYEYLGEKGQTEETFTLPRK
jgi:phage baseplate assembly protein W